MDWNKKRCICVDFLSKTIAIKNQYNSASAISSDYFRGKTALEADCHTPKYKTKKIWICISAITGIF